MRPTIRTISTQMKVTLEYVNLFVLYLPSTVNLTENNFFFMLLFDIIFLVLLILDAHYVLNTLPFTWKFKTFDAFSLHLSLRVFISFSPDYEISFKDYFKTIEMCTVFQCIGMITFLVRYKTRMFY